MIQTCEIKGKSDLDPDFGWTGILSAMQLAIRSTVHTTTRAMPSQLVFSHDAMLNVSFEANWQYIKDCKQRLTIQNNKLENSRRIPHQFAIGDRVMIKQDPNQKHGADRYSGPFTITQVNDNGTIKLTKVATNGRAVHETWNIRNLDPCKT